MQVSSLNEVKIYSLSCGKSLPEVSHLGALLAGQPPLVSALSLVCFRWAQVGSGLGEVQASNGARGAGRCW